MIEGAIYRLLKKHFNTRSYYVDLLELMHEVKWAIMTVTLACPWETPAYTATDTATYIATYIAAYIAIYIVNLL